MENSTEITTEVTESGEQPEVVVQEASHNSDFDIVDDDRTEAVDPSEGEEKETKPKQSAEDNHAAKQARLKAERDAKARAEAEADKRIRESGAINPYTEKPFKSLNEFIEYGKKVKEAELKERAESEGKTVEELQEEEEAREALKEKRQKESEAKEAEEAEENRKNFFAEDLQAFMEEFPDADVLALDADEKFHKFCGSRYGSEPLANLYRDYMELYPVPEKRDTRSSRSTGSGESGGAMLTTAQKKSLAEWNRQNPDMQMSAKEYLSR